MVVDAVFSAFSLHLFRRRFDAAATEHSRVARACRRFCRLVIEFSRIPAAVAAVYSQSTHTHSAHNETNNCNWYDYYCPCVFVRDIPTIAPAERSGGDQPHNPQLHTLATSRTCGGDVVVGRGRFRRASHRRRGFRRSPHLLP